MCRLHHEDEEKIHNDVTFFISRKKRKKVRSEVITLYRAGGLIRKHGSR